MSNLPAAGGQGQIQEIRIFSNYSEDVDFTDGFLDLTLYESILDHSIRASLTLVDTGYRNSAEGQSAIESEDINLTSGEKIEIKLSDGYNQTISCKGVNHLRINELQSVDEMVNKTIVSLDLYSKECIDNELEKTRVTKRYDGKITDSVNNILTEVLKTEKKVDIDPIGLNNFNFLGHVEKPFYKILWLAKRCVPDMPNAKNNLAGYFFWEVFNVDGDGGGYKFKSIDKLWTQTRKRKLIYNDLVTTPPEYDGKILAYSFDNSIRMDKLLQTGALSKPLLKSFDPYSNKYQETEFTDVDRLKPENMGGKEPPKIAADLDIWNTVTRISPRIFDTGTLPPGTTIEKQLEFSKEVNFNMDEILRQSYTRYNNLFTIKLSITIPGDFGVHAGDLIECHFPEVSSKQRKVVSEKKSGLYIVIDVKHKILPTGFYTQLNLARESILKK